MNDWLAVWSRSDDTGADWREAHAAMWDHWLAGTQQWWSWCVSAATMPWLQLPWPHVGQVTDPAPPPDEGPSAHASAARRVPAPHAEDKRRPLSRRKTPTG